MDEHYLKEAIERTRAAISGEASAKGRVRKRTPRT
jgi:hypothetical protein